MKKIFLGVVLAVTSLTAAAQVQTGLRYGVTLSGSMSKYSGVDGAKNIFGYGGGLLLEYNFTPSVYLGTGLQAALRGSKISSISVAGQRVNIDGDLKSSNLILPVNIGGRINVSNQVSVFGQAGPYVSYAVKKAGITIVGADDINSESFDWGVNGKVGLELFNEIQIYGGYELGLKKVWGDSSKNRSIVFGLSYFFK